MWREIEVGQVKKIMNFVHRKVVYELQKVCSSPYTSLLDVYTNDNDSVVLWPPTPC